MPSIRYWLKEKQSCMSSLTRSERKNNSSPVRTTLANGHCSIWISFDFIWHTEGTENPLKDQTCHSLHAARVQVAARRGHSHQTGGEGQQQRVAGPIQWQRQELTGLRGVLTTPGHSGTEWWKDGRQRVKRLQREVTVLFLNLWQGQRPHLLVP